MEKGDNSGAKIAVGSVLATVLLFAGMAICGRFSPPAGARNAWLEGQTLLVEEFRYDDGDEVPRLAVLDVKTGKRLADRAPDDLSTFAVAGDKVWLKDRRTFHLEAWSVKDLKTALKLEAFNGVKAADANVCSDGSVARVALVDGRYAVVQLSDGQPVADRSVTCGGQGASAASSSTGSSRGTLDSAAEGGTQRMKLRAANQPLGGGETFLDPQYALAPGGGALELDGDVFVFHRLQLGEDRRMKVSRVSAAGVKWSEAIGNSTSLERVLLAPPSTLVVVGHDGVTTLDATSGKVLWRTGN